ncbi:hypothetical protein C2S53_017889 [Perilla frutescens var. hirtella]|uniref:Uncharacterized protein n=1 Tax=Perilla frutescens var. hirtella TaxID=608512 RepID=A0AAD4NX06_PERFH|nr:hypothetical protein C2S53_017889 [Perilla frutescens var. hirtella]
MAIGFLVLALLCMEYEYYDHPHLVSAVEVRCVEREREALLRFKKGLVDDSVFSHRGEVMTTKWKGVVCSNTTAHAVSLLLDLSYSFDLSHHTNWLQQILKLRSLQELYLDGSNIAGAIPSANYSFASLSTLDLSYNEFTSTTLDWIVRIFLRFPVRIFNNCLSESNYFGYQFWISADGVSAVSVFSSEIV